MTERSDPPRYIRSAISPTLNYDDASAAIRWLVDMLGFEVTALYERESGEVAYAQLAWRGGAVNIATREHQGRRTGSASTYLTAPDPASVDEYFEAARARGAKILRPPQDNVTGNHAFTLEDSEGNLWNMGIAWLETEAARSLPERRI